MILELLRNFATKRARFLKKLYVNIGMGRLISSLPSNRIGKMYRNSLCYTYTVLKGGWLCKLSKELVCAQKKLAAFSHIHSGVPIPQHPLPFSFSGTHTEPYAANIGAKPSLALYLQKACSDVLTS